MVSRQEDSEKQKQVFNFFRLSFFLSLLSFLLSSLTFSRNSYPCFSRSKILVHVEQKKLFGDYDWINVYHRYRWFRYSSISLQDAFFWHIYFSIFSFSFSPDGQHLIPQFWLNRFWNLRRWTQYPTLFPSSFP